MNAANERLDYWDGYYERRPTVSIPSQFAVFVCDYLQPGQNVIEFGCGDGRDSLFFASQGYRVLGVDASAEAISLSRDQRERRHGAAAEFRQLRVRGDWSASAVTGVAAELRELLDPCQPTAVYARFFLHAITDEEEVAFLRLVKELLSGGLCAVEFRTRRDSSLKKETSAHYRRYIDPLCFHAEAAASGLEPVYFVEGFGYAKRKGDDAHVARFVLRE